MATTKELRLALTFTAPLLLLSVEFIRALGARHWGAFGEIGLGLLLSATFVLWSDYISRRGRESGRSLPGGKLLSDGEDQGE